MHEFIFYVIAGCVCLFALLSVTARSIFHCSMFLAMALLSIAGIYFYLDAQFLGIIQTLVYVGGIVTLFVYAIKLTASIDDRTIKQVNVQVLPAALIVLLLFVIILKLFGASYLVKLAPSPVSTTISQLGEALMTTYALPFEFMSVVLLAALVGAIVIGKVKS